MSYLLSNNTSFPQQYAPAAFEYPSNGNRAPAPLSSWDNYVASHTNSLGDVSNMGGYDYDDYGMMPSNSNARGGYNVVNAYKKKKKRAPAKAKAAATVAKKAATGAKVAAKVAKVDANIAKVAAKVAKKAASPRKSSPKRHKSPRKSPRKHHRKSPRKSPRKVATKTRMGHFGLRGQGAAVKSAVRKLYQASQVRHYTPSTQKRYAGLAGLQAHPGRRGFTTHQLMYRQLVAEMRHKGFSMKQIGAEWQRMKGGHKAVGYKKYYKAHLAKHGL